MLENATILSEGANAPIFGIPFENISLEALAQTIADGPLQGQKTRSIVTANVDHIVLLRKNLELREAYRNSWQQTIDGTPVWLYAKLRRRQVPDKVTGADLFPEVLKRLTPTRHRPYFVVATQEIAERLALWAEVAGFAADQIGLAVPPYGFERDTIYGNDLAARIRANCTTHLFFGVGCPRSEVWIDRHSNELGDVYALSVGAGIGFFVGTQRRAPRILRRWGMEWCWRLLSEPHRLAPRYIVGSWAFLSAIRSDFTRSKVKQ